MQKIKMILRKLLYPPKPVLYLLPPAVFAILIFIFVTGREKTLPAYLIFGMSAYCLTIIVAALPRLSRRIKSGIINSKAVKKLSSSTLGNRYLNDMTFRGGFSIYQGMAVNFLYAVFRTVTGIMYSSVWFISMAVYYFILGGMRAYLTYAFNRRDKKGVLYENECYFKTAVLLFILNIPMGGMILLMIVTNSGYSYPGYVIYLSALYTFYIMGMSIRNLVKYKKLGSPILSAAKVLNFVSAMMSVLGLQTAMISVFSTEGEDYRKLMNTLTGSVVYAGVVVTAIYMLIKSHRRRKAEKDE